MHTARKSWKRATDRKRASNIEIKVEEEDELVSDDDRQETERAPANATHQINRTKTILDRSSSAKTGSCLMDAHLGIDQSGQSHRAAKNTSRVTCAPFFPTAS